MKKLYKCVIAIFFSCIVSSAFADDVDIYLKTDEINSTPPYLMFMVDYRPSVFSGGCGTVAECYAHMSNKAFIQLCVGRAARASIDAGTLTTAQAIALCTRYMADIADDASANYSI